MAERVAKWPEQYGCDGIDLDLEEGAGARPEAGPNMVHFIRRLRQLSPKMIISQPTYGFPQVRKEKIYCLRLNFFFKRQLKEQR